MQVEFDPVFVGLAMGKVLDDEPDHLWTQMLLFFVALVRQVLFRPITVSLEQALTRILPCI